MEKQHIWSWYFTSARGVVRKQSAAKRSIQHVQQELVQVASGYARHAGDYAAVCWFNDQDAMQLFTAHELWTFLTALTTTSHDSVCLSAFVRPRGDLDLTRYANLEHEYR